MSFWGRRSYASADVSASYLLKIAEASLHQEEQRGESLATTSARLLTCASILLVALMTLLSFSYSLIKENVLLIPILIVFAIDLIAVLVALIFLLCSQRRLKYTALNSPKELSDFFETQPALRDNMEAAKYFCESIDSSYVSLQKKNNKVRKLISQAIGVLVASACLFILLVVGVAFVLVLGV